MTTFVHTAESTNTYNALHTVGVLGQAPPADIASADCGDYASVVQGLYDIFTAYGKGAAQREYLVRCKSDRALATLMNTPPPPSAGAAQGSAAQGATIGGVVYAPGGYCDITDENLGRVTEAIWRAVMDAPVGRNLYRFGGELAIYRKDAGDLRMLDGPKGRIHWRGLVNRSLVFARSAPARGNPDRLREVVPPLHFIEDSLYPENIPAEVPPVDRLATIPTFVRGHTDPLGEGYHAAQRVLVTSDITPHPMTVSAALDLIVNDLLIDFPFATQADRVNAVGLLLLPFVRDLCDATPLFLVDAATRGTGKTLLADLLHTIWAGASAPLAGLSLDAEEQRKAITTHLIAAPMAVMFDDVAALGGHALNRAITGTEWNDRLLGANVNTTLPIRCVWIATGNNVTLQGDMVRRVVMIRLESDEETPSQRTGFKRGEAEIREWVRENRAELVSACCALIRHGLHTTGDLPVPTMGGFARFAQVLGHITSAVGMPGFASNLDAVAEREDSDEGAWRAMISLWWHNHGGTAIKAADILALIDADKEGLIIDGESDRARMMKAAGIVSKAAGRVYHVDGQALRITQKRHRSRLVYQLQVAK